MTMSPNHAGSVRGDPPAALIHQAFPYRGREEFLATALPFLTQGVRDGAAVVCVSGTDNLGLLRAELTPDVADRVRFERSNSWYVHPHQALATTSRAIERHVGAGRPVRFLGEPLADRQDASVLWPELGPWLRYEALLNAALAGHPAWVLCPYDAAVLDGDLVEELGICHPQITWAGLARPSAAYQPPLAHYRRWNADELPEPSRLLHAQAVTARVLPDMRRELTAHARTAGLSAPAAADLAYGVSEVVSNAIEHAGGVATIRVWTQERHLVCEVRDYGHGMVEQLPGLLPPSPLAARGRGLWLARQMCEDVDIRTGPNGTTVRMRACRDRQEACPTAPESTAPG